MGERTMGERESGGVGWMDGGSKIMTPEWMQSMYCRRERPWHRECVGCNLDPRPLFLFLFLLLLRSTPISSSHPFTKPLSQP